MEVSIVVNSYNPKGDARVRTMTELALRSYRAFTGLPHELILVDGHVEPDAHLASVCAELEYRYLNLAKRLSFAEGYNTGLRAAWHLGVCWQRTTYSWLIAGWKSYLKPQTAPELGWLRRIFQRRIIQRNERTFPSRVERSFQNI